MSNIYQQFASQTGATWDNKVDNLVYAMASALQTAGWTISRRDPYIKIRMTTDMVGFGGLPGFYTVYPPAGVVGKKKVLIVDSIGSFPYDPNEYLLMETGSTAKEIVFPFVIQAFEYLGTSIGEFTEYGPDPDDPLPNTRLIINENGDPLVQGVDTPGYGTALNLQTPEFAYGGGYVCTCEPKDEPDNYTSIFICRNHGVDELTRPGPPAIYFGKTFPLAPVLVQSQAGTDRTASQEWPMTTESWTMAAGPNYAFAWHDSNNFLHFEVAALELPVSQAGIIEATFSLAGDIRTTFSFRTRPIVGGAIKRQTINGTTLWDGTDGQHTPRLLCLWNLYTDGTLWENELGQIHEPWVAFSNNASRKASILGRIPDAILFHKAVEPDTFGVFQFDGAYYKAITRNVILGSGNAFGSLAVKIDSTATNECSISD